LQGLPPRPEKITDLLLSPQSHASLAKHGIDKLMPIQAATIQHLRAGTDVIARAKVRAMW
jgi:superfamily II DNA/RNA helicase